MRACCLCPTGVPGAGGPACGAGLLCVPVGGGPPASRPRRELRSARRLEARPGPATAHGHRSLALRSLRRPPHRWGRVADVWLYASPRSLARPRHRPRAPQPGSPNPQCGLACRAGILGRSAVCCYKRRQSDGFFVWISDPLLQTSSIRRLFR